VSTESMRAIFSVFCAKEMAGSRRRRKMNLFIAEFILNQE